MLFVLIRISPVLIPVLYVMLLKGMFYADRLWLWFLITALIINAAFFFFLYLKKRNSQIFLFLLHSLVFTTIGFLYALILGGGVAVNLFIAGWAIIYFIYLESIFHYFYQTKKVLLVDLKNIISYVNLVSFFFLVTFLINLYIFINFSWWLILILIFVSSLILIISQFKANDLPSNRGLLYSLVVSIMITEIAIVALLLPVSFYVSAVIISILYYLFTSLSVIHVRGELTKEVIIQYIVFTVIVSLIIIITSQWL